MQRRQMIARFYSASVFVDWQPAGIDPVNTFNPHSRCMFYLS